MSKYICRSDDRINTKDLPTRVKQYAIIYDILPHKQLCHEVMLRANLEDIFACYILFKPLYPLKYYYDHYIVVKTYMSKLYGRISCHCIPMSFVNMYVYDVKVNGLLHSAYDDPALVMENGDMIWFNHGLIHRDNDKPAIIQRDGTRKWFTNGMLHREYGPAIIYPDGTEEWYKFNELYFCGMIID